MHLTTAAVTSTPAGTNLLLGVHRCIHLSSERWEPGQATQPLLSAHSRAPRPSNARQGKRDQAKFASGEAPPPVLDDPAGPIAAEAAERGTDRESARRRDRGREEKKERSARERLQLRAQPREEEDGDGRSADSPLR